MKTVIVAINAKFEHEGLAVWYLKAACNKRHIPLSVQQHSINDSQQKIWAAILEEEPDVVAFSCYIWNRFMVEKLIADLKKAKPSLVVVLGGPEASYEGAERDFLQSGVDYILKGSGETRFPDLLDALVQGNPERFMNNDAILKEVDQTYISPFVPEYLSRISGRIAYIESSRGCPYRCSYCLSSESPNLAFHPLDAVKEDLESLVKAGAKVIKFVDRSFNVNREHAMAIWEFIKVFKESGITFHFEVNPDKLTEDQISLLAGMPKGLMQIEAGIQSTNELTLKSVSRVMDVDAALVNLKRIIEVGNIHVHSDLIAGLPYEDLKSFMTSFNRVYDVGAHQLQLGFLKLLHGTRIRREATIHGYTWRDYPPYEVISNQYMDPMDFLILKGIEELIDRFYNSGRLYQTLNYVIGYYQSPYDFYEQLYQYLKEQQILYQAMAPLKLYQVMKSFAKDKQMPVDQAVFHSVLALDYVMSMKITVLPELLFPEDEDVGLTVLDHREYLDEALYRSLGKGESKKRFFFAEVTLPIKKGEGFIAVKNRIRIDVRQVDPVTGRAVMSFI